MIWTSRKYFIRLVHATDQKRHLGLIRLRKFKRRWVSVANDHIGPKPLISDSATRRSLWPLQCQPAALDDNEWQISKTLVECSIQTHGQVSKKSYFDIWHFWKSDCWFRLIWGLDHRSRSRSRSRECCPGAGAGAGADQKFHGSASLVFTNARKNVHFYCVEGHETWVLTRAQLGGGGLFQAPSRFLAISSKPMQVAPPNLQYPLSQHFYTLC